MKKSMNNDNVDAIIEQPMSSTTVKNYSVPIVMFSDVARMNDIEEVFRGKNEVVLFVGIESPNDGHYQCLFRNANGLFFFDSYGYAPTKIIDKLMKEGRAFGQNNNLMNLVKKSGLPFAYNKKKYQESGGDVQTCGRYCVMVSALNNMHKERFNLNVYQKMMDYLKTKYNKTYDEIVSYFVNK